MNMRRIRNSYISEFALLPKYFPCIRGLVRHLSRMYHNCSSSLAESRILRILFE